MSETPREYKKRIDETREKWKSNRDKLLECLENYELVNEEFKTKTRKTILENFEKNEKAEKGNELYIKIGEELSNIEIKYKNLEMIKKTFEEKKSEKNEKIEKLRGYSMTGEDETTIKIQRAEMKKIENEISIVNEEIKAIEQEIKEKEAEIKDIEEIYGERKGKEELVERENGNTTKIESKTDNKEQESGTGETLREHRRKILKELQKINHTRHDIIKLLNEGIGVDEELKKEIKDVVSKKFFDYYDEKTGTIKMKASKLDGARGIKYSKKYERIEKRSEINGIPIYKLIKDGKQSLAIGNKELGIWFDDIGPLQEIGGKPCFRAERDGKYCIMWRKEQQGEWFDDINLRKRGPKEIGGKICFEAERDGKYCIMWHKEQQGGRYDKISEPKEIGGKLAFHVEKNGKHCLIWGTEQQGDWFDDVNEPEEIGGKPAFSVEKNGKHCLIWGNEQYSKWFDNIRYPEEIGGKLAFHVEKNGKNCLMWGIEQQGDWFDDTYELEEIGGKPTFLAKKDGKECVIWGKEQQCEWFDDIKDLQEIGGKPCFRAERDGKYCIMWGKEQQGIWFDTIYNCCKEIGGKPVFEAKKDGKYCIMRGTEQQGDWFNMTNNLQEFGGKPIFGAKKQGQGCCVMRGCEKISEWFRDLEELKSLGGKLYYKKVKDYWSTRIMRGNEEFEEISEQQEIGGKPCFKVKKHGKRCVMRGDEQQGDWFDKIYDPEEIGGKPCFRAERDGKYCIMWGKEQQGIWFDDVGYPLDFGGKLFFIAKKEGKYCIMRGSEQQGDLYDDIENIKEIGGKLCFKAKKNGKRYLIRGNEKYRERQDGMDKVREVGGKPCYTQEKSRRNNYKYQLIRGDGEQTEWFDSIGDVIDLGTQPMYFAKKGGEYFIMNGNVQITEGFSNYEKIDEDEFNIKYKITYNDGCERIITISKKTKKAEKRDNGHGTPQEEASEQIDTQRGLRERTIITRYENLLNLKELIKYLKENKIYDEGEFDELKRELTENFFGNYEKAKENDGFQTAENEYRKIKTKTREHISKDKELKTAQLEDSEILENIDTKMLKIADEIMKTEGGSMLKRIGLNKLRKERDELEKHKNRIMSLQKEEFKLRMQSQEQKKVYGPKIDRNKLKGKSEEELRRWLNLGEITKVKTLKEYKEKHNEIIENSERIVGFIKSLDLGISEELKEGIIEKIEKFIRSSIEIQEGGDLLKMANDTEKYIEENIGNIIKELREKKEKIQDIKEKIKSFEGQKEKAEYNELLKINDEIYELKEIQIKLKNEYDGVVKSINEILYKYDGSDIESRL